MTFLDDLWGASFTTTAEATPLPAGGGSPPQAQRQVTPPHQVTTAVQQEARQVSFTTQGPVVATIPRAITADAPRKFKIDPYTGHMVPIRR